MAIKNYNYISTFNIIERIARDTDYQDVNTGDFVEWCWEVLEMLNIPMTYIDKVAHTTTVDYRGILPSDINSLLQVRDFNTQTPLIETSYLYYKSPNKFDADYDPASTNSDGGPTEWTTDQQTAHKEFDQYQYKIENGFIYTEYDDKKIEIAYSGYPICEKGYPMIPEDIKVINAVKGFIIYKLDWKLWRRGKLTDKVKMDSEQEYLYAVAAAQSWSNLPSVIEMENIRRFSAALVTDTNQFDKSFKTL